MNLYIKKVGKEESETPLKGVGVNFLIKVSMKSLVFGLTIAVFCINTISCQTSSKDIVFPKGTVFKKSDSSVSFTLPKGYEMIIPDGNSFKASVSGNYKCECTKSDGLCKPSSAGDTVGCYTELDTPCTECKGKVTSASLELSEPNVYFKKSGGGVMSFPNFSKVQPVMNFEDWLKSNWLSEKGFAKIQDEIEEIYADFEVMDSEKMISILAISSEGKFVIDLPMRAISNDIIYPGTGPTDGPKFNCTGCQGNCKLKKEMLGKIKYCDGCDSGCTLHWN